MILVAFVLVSLTGCGNYAPTISGVTASPSSVQPGEQATLTCTATDQDGDMLSYEWTSVDEGGTTNPNASFDWTAPANTGPYRFKVTVSDGKGGVAYDSSLIVTVAYNGIEAVTMLPAKDIGTRKATIMWTSAANSWMSYELYRSETPGVNGDDKLVKIMNYGNGYDRLDTFYTDIDLDPGKTYYYAVQVSDSSDNKAFSEEISVTTTSFEYVGSRQPLGGGHGVRLANKDLFIYCAALEQSVRIFTIGSAGLSTGPTIPHPLNDNSTWAWDLYVTGDRLDVAFGKGGYCSYIISNPFNPIETTTVDVTTLGGEARAIYSVGKRIFVGCTNPATATHTLVSFDWDNTGALTIDTLYGIPEDIQVSNGHIYIAEGDAGLEILSWDPTATDPVQPVSKFTTYDMAHRVFVAGQYAYVAAGTQGFVVVDVGNPTNPYQAALWAGDPASNAWGIQTSGNIVYVSDGIYGLRVLNLTNPLYPYHIGTKDITSIVGANDLRDVIIRSEGSVTQAVLSDWNNAIHMIRW